MRIQLNSYPFQRVLRIGLLLAGAAGMVLTVPGCVTSPQPKEPVEDTSSFVWPAPPEQPRIRYLGSLESLKDVAGKEQKSLRDILMGKEEEGRTTLIKPYGVHSDSKGRVYVADTGIAALVVFDLKQKSVSFWGVAGLGALRKPVGVTSDAEGNVYVSDVLGQRVMVSTTPATILMPSEGKVSCHHLWAWSSTSRPGNSTWSIPGGPRSLYSTGKAVSLIPSASAAPNLGTSIFRPTSRPTVAGACMWQTQ